MRYATVALSRVLGLNEVRRQRQDELIFALQHKNLIHNVLERFPPNTFKSFAHCSSIH